MHSLGAIQIENAQNVGGVSILANTEQRETCNSAQIHTDDAFLRREFLLNPLDHELRLAFLHNVTHDALARSELGFRQAPIVPVHSGFVSEPLRFLSHDESALGSADS